MTCQLISDTDTIPITTDSLDEVKTLIVENHRQIEELKTIGHQAQCSSLKHAKAIGDLLLKVKKGLKHGQWEKWFDNNIASFSIRTARNYMAIAENWKDLKKKENVADLTLTKALNRLKQKHAKEQKAEDKLHSAPALYELYEQLTTLICHLDHYRTRTTTHHATSRVYKRMDAKIIQTQVELGAFRQQLQQHTCQTTLSVTSHENESV